MKEPRGTIVDNQQLFQEDRFDGLPEFFSKNCSFCGDEKKTF